MNEPNNNEAITVASTLFNTPEAIQGKWDLSDVLLNKSTAMENPGKAQIKVTKNPKTKRAKAKGLPDIIIKNVQTDKLTTATDKKYPKTKCNQNGIIISPENSSGVL
jgi:hypothetical protein